MMCPRCKGILLGGLPPSVSTAKEVNGIKYHFYCAGMVEEELAKLAKKPKEVNHEKQT